MLRSLRSLWCLVAVALAEVVLRAQVQENDRKTCGSSYRCGAKKKGWLLVDREMCSPVQQYVTGMQKKTEFDSLVSQETVPSRDGQSRRVSKKRDISRKI